MTRALRAGGALGKGRVRRLAQIPDIHPRGYLGKIVRYRLDLAGPGSEGPETVVAKFPPDDRTFAFQYGYMTREVRFYRELSQGIPIRIPHCWFAGIEPEPGKGDRGDIVLPNSTPIPIISVLMRLARWRGRRDSSRILLILEDFSEARNGDPQKGCSEQEAVGVVRSLARLHAKFWEDGAIKTLPWVPRAFGYPPFFLDLYRRELRIRHTGRRDELPDVVIRTSRWLAEAGEEVFRRLGAFPSTLLHGDTRLDNLFFWPDQVGFVDWQTVTKGVGVLDVTTFILGTEGGVEREDLLIREYHNALLEHGVRGFTFDHCLQASALSKLFLYIRGIGLAHMSEARVTNRLAGAAQREMGRSIPSSIQGLQDLLLP